MVAMRNVGKDGQPFEMMEQEAAQCHTPGRRITVKEEIREGRMGARGWLCEVRGSKKQWRSVANVGIQAGCELRAISSSEKGNFCKATKETGLEYHREKGKEGLRRFAAV